MFTWGTIRAEGSEGPRGGQRGGGWGTGARASQPNQAGWSRRCVPALGVLLEESVLSGEASCGRALSGGAGWLLGPLLQSVPCLNCFSVRN